MFLRILVARLITISLNFLTFSSSRLPRHVLPPSPSSSVAHDDVSFDLYHVDGWSRLSAIESE